MSGDAVQPPSFLEQVAEIWDRVLREAQKRPKIAGDAESARTETVAFPEQNFGD